MSLNGLESLKDFPLQNDQISETADDLQTYGRDWTKFVAPSARAIVFPQSTADVVSIVKWAVSQKLKLVPSGGRTGLSGGAVAAKHEIVVSFDRMNKILSFEKEDPALRVQAGVTTEEVQQESLRLGFYFPVDFASRGTSQIGGNIATNAGGLNVLRYGMMRDWVTDIEFVTGAGEVLNLNRGLVKNASGYDFRHLVIGSEGTLGFVTAATLKLTYPPGPRHVLFLAIQSVEWIPFVYQAFRSRLSLQAFEFLSQIALNLVLEHHSHLKPPFPQAHPQYVLIDFEETDQSSSGRQSELALEIFESCVEKGWVVDGIVSQSADDARELWKLRELISESCSHYMPYKNDISVRVSQLFPFLKELQQQLETGYPEFTVVWFGHIGDGNLHINILKPKQMTADDFLKACHKVDQIVFKSVEKYKGSISAEHGIGLLKRDYLSLSRSSVEINLMRQIKQVFDPHGIMNPGKLLRD